MKTLRIKMIRLAGWAFSTFVLAVAVVLLGGCDVGTGSAPADGAPEPTRHVQTCSWGSCDTPPNPTEEPAPVPTDSAGNPLW